MLLRWTVATSPLLCRVRRCSAESKSELSRLLHPEVVVDVEPTPGKCDLKLRLAGCFFFSKLQLAGCFFFPKLQLAGCFFFPKL